MQSYETIRAETDGIITARYVDDSPEAEDEYDEALQAIIDARCAEGIEELRAADRSIRQSPSADFFIPFDDGR